jgi:ABC-2 type transport system ATP-binding protein
MSENTIIEFQNLTKIYKEGLFLKRKPSVENISFQVSRGKIFGFLGANGAGKTTSIKIAMGLQSATSGFVKIFGQECTNVEARARIGYLPERPYLQMNLRAMEFLDLHRSLFGSLAKPTKQLTNEYLLNLVGLGEAKELYLRSFSKGMLQRIGIAQALINDPELVIFDEPMSGLDPVGRRDIRNLMLDLNKQGKTVFFSSHILSDIESICEQIAFLEKGKLKYLGGVEELVKTGKQKIEVIARLAENTDSLLRSQFQPFGEYHRAVLESDSEAHKIVRAVWDQQGSVKSFGPIQKSLEDILFGGV